jgi:DNA-binding transcriptional regulator YiaG
MDIKKIRRSACMDQKEFAKLLGVTKATISYWENDKVEIAPKNLKKIKEFCEKNNIKFEN